jgi:hypothetical protein
MAKYNIEISDEVFADLGDIFIYIKSINTYRAAKKFTNELKKTIRELQTSAEIYATSTFDTVLKYHPQAKSILSKNRNWTIIFYVEDANCYVLKILPSKMILNEV